MQRLNPTDPHSFDARPSFSLHKSVIPWSTERRLLDQVRKVTDVWKQV